MDEDSESEDERMSTTERSRLNLDLVSQCIKALFRIGMLIRKSSAQDRFQRALQRSEPEFPAQYDTDYIAHKYTKLSSSDTNWLASRLGSANAKRRHFIKYGREHQARLQGFENTLTDETALGQSSKATTFNGEERFDSSRISEEDNSMSMVSVSTTFDNDKCLHLPNLTSLSPSGDVFECPICFIPQSFKNDKLWK